MATLTSPWSWLSWRQRRWQRLQRQRQALAQQLAANTSDRGAVLAHPLARTLAAPLPNSDCAIADVDCLAIDLEATGLDPTHDEIISIGWVPIRAGVIQIAGSDHLIVSPRRQVGQSATIHGIRDCDRDSGIALEEALGQLFTALAHAIPVFHHGRLDLGFIDRACRNLCGCAWPTLYLDTLQWQYQRQQRRQNERAHGAFQLSAVLEHHHLPLRHAHNALDDAQSCAEVLIALTRKARTHLADVAAIWQPSPG